MPWQLHTSDALRAQHGPDALRHHLEGLKDLLDRNDLPVPRFPAMVWARERLADGVEVAVGIARDGEDLRGYVWPADKVQFVGTEEIAVEHQPDDEGAGAVRLLHWYKPPGH